MNGFLLDTHVWCWYLAGSDRLSGEARSVIEKQTSECWLSSISVWEAGMLIRKGRIRIDTDFDDWLGTAFARLPLQSAPLTFEIAQRSLGIELATRDPADAFLVATAVVHDLVLVTSDRQLLEAPGVLTRRS